MDPLEVSWYLHNQPKNWKYNETCNVLSQAFNVWSLYLNIEFIRLTNYNEIKDKDFFVDVGFYSNDHGDKHNFDGVGGILAHALPFFRKRSGFIHFDIDEPWTNSWFQAFLKKGVLLYNVAIHEMGHVLHLTHSSQRESVMMPDYNYNFYGVTEKDVFNISSRLNVKIKSLPKQMSNIEIFARTYDKEILLTISLIIIIIILFNKLSKMYK